MHVAVNQWSDTGINVCKLNPIPLVLSNKPRCNRGDHNNTFISAKILPIMSFNPRLIKKTEVNAFHFLSLSFVNGFWIGWIWSVLKIPFVTHLLLMAKTPKWEMEIPWKWWELIDFCIFYAELNTSMIMSMLMRCEIDLLSFREREIERDVDALVPFDSLRVI